MTRQQTGRFVLAAITATTLVVWLVVLPRIAEGPEMRRYLNDLDRQGINGNATYYTELDMMDRILDRLEK